MLDAAAWARNVLYVLAGHCNSAVTVSTGRSARSKGSVISPTQYNTYRDLKDAVQASVWNSQRRAGAAFAELHKSNPAHAQR